MKDATTTPSFEAKNTTEKKILRYRWHFIEFKVDILALLAFIISITVAFYQSYWFFKGSDVSVIPPEQVMIRPWFDKNGVPENTHVFARLTTINLAPPQQPETVLRAMITLSVGDQHFTHHWQHFITTKPGQEKWLSPEGDATPFVVSGRSSISREVWFRPRVVNCAPDSLNCNPRQNWVRWSDFLTWLDSNSEIIVTISVELASGEFKHSSCNIIIDDVFLATISKKNWHAPPCYSSVD